MSYMERICTAEEGEAGAADILREAMAEAGRDLTLLVNKWADDMPILLTAVRASVPQIENWCGESGRAAADALQKITASAGYRVEKK